MDVHTTPPPRYNRFVPLLYLMLLFLFLLLPQLIIFAHAQSSLDETSSTSSTTPTQPSFSPSDSTDSSSTESSPFSSTTPTSISSTAEIADSSSTSSSLSPDDILQFSTITPPPRLLVEGDINLPGNIQPQQPKAYDIISGAFFQIVNKYIYSSSIPLFYKIKI